MLCLTALPALDNSGNIRLILLKSGEENMTKIIFFLFYSAFFSR